MQIDPALGAAIVELGAALACGGLIGVERQWRHRTAGLKTNALVAVAAAGFMLLGRSNADLGARVAAQIVTGIGFLGAGVILRDGMHIRGLNTAATVWGSAACGTLCGAGELLLGALLTGFVLLVNLGLQPLVSLLNRLPERAGGLEAIYDVTARCEPARESDLRAAFIAAVAAEGLGADGLSSLRPSDDAHSVALTMTLRLPERDDARVERILARVRAADGAIATGWTIEATIE